MTVTITVCSTCKFSETTAFNVRGETGGDQLLKALTAEAGNRDAPVRLVAHECLWACRHSCAVLIESEGRTGHLAGRFTPDQRAAEAILDWCEAYAETPDGSVPYGQWPEGIKGHFLARLPARTEPGGR